ncbi:MAG: TRAP transporter small permease [Pseudomonadales bacterium]
MTLTLHRKVQAGLHLAEDGALMLALLVMLGTAVGQILLRNLFDSGFLWAESFLRILVLWVAMLGAMVATREKNHICIDLLSSSMKGLPLTVTRLATSLFAAFICGLVAWHSLTIVGYEYEDETIAFAWVPVWVCQAIIPFGFAVMGVRFLLTSFSRQAET